MFRTIRCLVMVTLLLAVAVPALQAQEAPASGKPAVESGLWTGFVSWVSSLFTGGGPFIDPNGEGRTVTLDRDRGRLAQEEGGAALANPAG